MPKRDSTVEADYLVGRVRTRLNASHQANKILVDCVYEKPSPVPGSDPAFMARVLSLAKTLGVLSFTPSTMLQACAQAIDFKVGHHFGEGQGWTDSWCHRRCMHVHQTLIDAARCGMRQIAGWYVLAVTTIFEFAVDPKALIGVGACSFKRGVL